MKARMKLNREGLLTPLATTLVGGLLTFQLLVPGLKAASAERTGLQEQIATLQQDVASMPAEQARKAKLEKEYETLRLSLPDNEALDEVLADLQDAASALNVQTGRISRSVQPSDIAGVTAVNLEVQLSGTYPRIQAFVQTLSRLPRAYTAQGINLSAGTSGSGVVGGTLKLTTYTRDKTPPPPPPPDETGAASGGQS